jgi:hypothetical protein|tara:strand:+ start:1715 stop:2014 length:300 start_codon:yes stop_codon:yes gene_type:complete
MKKIPYWNLSQVVDFNRYIESISGSKNPFRALLLVIKGSYNIYRGKSTNCAKKISYARYLKPIKQGRFAKLASFIKNYFGELEITASLVGAVVLMLFVY